MLKAGIVGIPNVGKSTLFNALTASYQAESANYPFCTIEPNVGIVEVPDPRLAVLQALAETNTVIPAVFEFVDIAGLVRGASKGEGLGNQFLANIREVDAIVHVVRCFEDGDVVHVEEKVDPVRDLEIIHIELCLADAASLAKRMERLGKQVKAQDKTAQAELALYEKILPWVENGDRIPGGDFTDGERLLLERSQLLSSKPAIIAANVAETDLAKPDANPHVQALTQWAKPLGIPVVPVSARIEAELISLEDPAERQDYLGSLGVETSGISQLIAGTFQLLGRETYFTAGKKEVHAWPFPKGATAPQCAGIIHTDFEKGFIRAEVCSYADYVAHGGEKGAKEKGLLRLEGKDYVMQDGDVVHFRFNV